MGKHLAKAGVVAALTVAGAGVAVVAAGGGDDWSLPPVSSAVAATETGRAAKEVERCATDGVPDDCLLPAIEELNRAATADKEYLEENAAYFEAQEETESYRLAQKRYDVCIGTNPSADVEASASCLESSGLDRERERILTEFNNRPRP